MRARYPQQPSLRFGRLILECLVLFLQAVQRCLLHSHDPIALPSLLLQVPVGFDLHQTLPDPLMGMQLGQTLEGRVHRLKIAATSRYSPTIG